MQRYPLTLLIILFQGGILFAQNKSAVDQVLEGGKVLVELLKVFSGDKVKDDGTGCTGRHADLCITNARDSSLTVAITHRTTEERRELVIARDIQECSLRLPEGVWTYDLRVTGTIVSIRKGDLLVEGCNDVSMTIR